MFVKCLNDAQKDDIVDRITNHGESQTDVATAYVVSRRTIQRVLQERGVLGVSNEKILCTTNDKALLNVVHTYKILDPDTLINALSRPALTLNNVVLFLSDMSDENYDKMQSLTDRVRELRKERKARDNDAA